MDFGRDLAPVVLMEDARDMAERLCTAAGMIMEDASSAAILRDITPSLEARIAAVASAGRDISALAAAAEVVARRWP